MQFLMLWSGDKPGLRKGIVQGVANSKGIVGHYRGGKVYLPDAKQVRELLPKRYRKAFDAQCIFDGSIVGFSKVSHDSNAPLILRLQYARPRRYPMLQLYFQPLTEDAQGGPQCRL